MIARIHPDCKDRCLLLEHKGYHTCAQTGRCEYLTAQFAATLPDEGEGYPGIVHDFETMKQKYAELQVKHQVACDTIVRQRNDNERLSAYVHTLNDARGRALHRAVSEVERLRAENSELSAFSLALQGSLKDAEAKLAELQVAYSDLILQVGNKYPGETRHETAKRYIRSCEEPRPDDARACADAMLAESKP